ncbi:MAG: hypothetical protein ACTSQY_11760 [Candidatus Odinarchaeia archaeon]
MSNFININNSIIVKDGNIYININKIEFAVIDKKKLTINFYTKRFPITKEFTSIEELENFLNDIETSKIILGRDPKYYNDLAKFNENLLTLEKILEDIKERKGCKK